MTSGGFSMFCMTSGGFGAGKPPLRVQKMKMPGLVLPLTVELGGLGVLAGVGTGQPGAAGAA
jgi:hypothetical protein